MGWHVQKGQRAGNLFGQSGLVCRHPSLLLARCLFAQKVLSPLTA
jgi:hypothetical protein